MGERFLFALDIETTGLDRFNDRVLGVGILNHHFSQFFTDLEVFKSWLDANPKAQFVCHNGSFDVNFLLQKGVDIRSHFAYDTKSIASILVPLPKIAEGEKSALSLQNLGITCLKIKPWKLDRENMESYPIHEVAQYCLKDCKVTFDLLTYLESVLTRPSWEFVDSWLMPATKLCADLEWNGIAIDKSGLELYQAESRQKRDEILAQLKKDAERALIFYHENQTEKIRSAYKEMYEKAKEKSKDKEKCRNRYRLLEDTAISKLQPFNWNSSEQLKWLLRDYYNLDIRNDRTDKETTDEAMLKSLDHPIAKRIAQYREVEKLCSTCIPALLENISKDGLVHAHYNVGGTRTGRLSSSRPNHQNIPKGPIRSYVQAADNSKALLTVDYSQIEVRILAHLAKESELIKAFEEGIDAYSVIAQKLLKVNCDVRDIKEKFKKERDVSKTAGLSILYGTGPAKLQEVLNKELNKEYSLQECRSFIQEYRDSLPGVQYLRKNLERQLVNQKVAYNLLGRPFFIESNEDIYMKGLNTLVQGSASDLVIWSQTEFVIPELKKLGINFKHRMLIHDESVIVLEADEAELVTTDVIIPAMTTSVRAALNLTIPLTVEYNISKRWEKP